jgi:membrane protein
VPFIPKSLLVVVRTMHALWQRFDRHQGMLRASALSFDTTLGLVPLFALAFVGLKLAGVQHLLEPFLLKQLAGDSRETGTRIIQYVDNAKVGSLSAFSLVALLASLFFLLENVRNAFNAVWDAQEQRSLLRRCADYLILVCAAPILLVAAFAMTSFVQSQWLVQWLVAHNPMGERLLLLFSLTPYLCSVLVLMLTYRLLSGVQVHFRSALVGGIVAGAVWQMAHWAYFHFQFGIARHNAMYGALALIPFLLIWIYTSWLLVLLGLELVRCHQQGGMMLDEAFTVER